jgi:hypothetical protein
MINHLFLCQADACFAAKDTLGSKSFKEGDEITPCVPMKTPPFFYKFLISSYYSHMSNDELGSH